MMRFHPFFYVLLFTFYFSSINLAEEGQWTQKADMPTPRAALSTSAVNGKIYAIGGSPDNNRPLSTVEEYDLATDTWTKKTDMPTPRFYLTTSVVNGKIYAIGGSAGGPLSTVEEYDPVKDKWIRKTDMPTARAVLSSSVVNGKIYAISGNSTAVEEYDPATDKWTKKADIPGTRHQSAASAVNGKIYVTGGVISSRSSSIVEEYDPATDTWTKKADMPTARAGVSTNAVNGKIYAIGGFVQPSGPSLSTVEEYDPVTDTWTKKADMPRIKSYFFASVVNGKIYAIGGFGSKSVVYEYDTGFAGEDLDFYIHSLLPDFGDPKGGSPIQIRGEIFIPGSRVFFGGIESNNVKVESSSLIMAVAPPRTPGLVDIEVVRPDGRRAVLKNGFQYTTIKITKIKPESGPISGDIKVQVEGVGFQSGAEVLIGDKKLMNLFVTPFLIQGILPPGDPGTLDVSVINPGGERDIRPRAFTYVSSPVIKRVSPIFIPALGGKEITIEGSGFIRTPTVQISGIAIRRIDFISSDELKILTASAHAQDIGLKDVIVTNPDGQRSVFPKGVTVLAPIGIESVEPNSGGLEGGIKITIVGKDFVISGTAAFQNSRFVEGAEVFIGKEKASDVTVVSDNIITAITPPNTPGPKTVEVINVDGQADTFDNGFSYNPLPQIIKVIPNNGPLSGGTKIRIQGSKFLPGAKVLIGDVDANSYIVASAPEVASDAFITAITPKVPLDEPGLRDVIVVNADGQEVILRDGYRYNPLPTIRDLSPSYGPSSGGTKVIIRGTGFLLGARVIIGKREATTQVKDDATIEAVTPANPKGRLDVKVLNPDTQEAVIPRAFISVVELAYNYPNPFQASRGTTFRYVPGPNESVESIVVRIFNLAGVPIGVVGQEGSNEVRWQDSKVNVGLYVYLLEVRVGGQVKRFKRALEVYK